MDFGQTIKAALARKSMSQVDLARTLGVSTNTIQRWIKMEARPRTGRILEIAKLLDVDAADLLQLAEGLGASDLSVNDAGNVAYGPDLRDELPLISWVQAGAFAEVQDPYHVGDYERLVPVTRKYSSRAFCLRIQGDSMTNPTGQQPTFGDGALIMVEPTQAATNGSFVVAKLPGEQSATFKKLVYDGDKRYLRPLNPAYPTIEIDEETEIVGVVRQMVMDLD